MDWFKSSYSADADCCVEVLIEADAVHIRDSKTGTDKLSFSHAEWQAFIAGAKAGEFDLT